MRLLALLLLLPAAAMAQDMPALYRVTGVASDDVLNVREQPGAASAKIGALGPGETGVEVTALNDDRSWGRVNVRGRAGWVSMRFLADESPDGGDYAIAQRLHCAGAEPFWGLEILQGTEASFRSPDESGTAWSVGQLQPAAARRDRFFLLGQGKERNLSVVLRRTTCSDGMSDMLYGLEADVLMTGHRDPVLYTGCCSLTR